MQKVVVSFTTSPSRMFSCTKMVEAIRKQTQAPDLFILNVPDVFARTGEKYVVPRQLTNVLSVNRCGPDWGPATKFVPTIEFLKANNFDPGTRIIVIDDDWCYPSGMVAEYAKADPTIAWTLQGLKFSSKQGLPKKAENFESYLTFSEAAAPFFSQHYQITKERRANQWCLLRLPNLQHNMFCDVLEAWNSFCVTLDMFKDDFMGYMRDAMTCDLTKFADDLTISNYLAKHGVERRVFLSPECNIQRLVPIMTGILGEDALRNGGALDETNLARYVNLLHKWEDAGENYLMNGRKPKCLQD